ncbi:MAG: hypothetical protein ACK5N8_09175 [Alphaproteobacteria bacterium]
MKDYLLISFMVLLALIGLVIFGVEVSSRFEDERYAKDNNLTDLDTVIVIGVWKQPEVSTLLTQTAPYIDITFTKNIKEKYEGMYQYDGMGYNSPFNVSDYDTCLVQKLPSGKIRFVKNLTKERINQ